MAVKDIVFKPGDGATWIFEAMYDNGTLTSLWVRALHWPGCDDDSEHGPIGFGVCKPQHQFLQSHRDFWEETGIDTAPVLDAVARVMATGDLADALLEPQGSNGEDEVH